MRTTRPTWTSWACRGKRTNSLDTLLGVTSDRAARVKSKREPWAVPGALACNIGRQSHTSPAGLRDRSDHGGPALNVLPLQRSTKQLAASRAPALPRHYIWRWPDPAGG